MNKAMYIYYYIYYNFVALLHKWFTAGAAGLSYRYPKIPWSIIIFHYMAICRVSHFQTHPNRWEVYDDDVKSKVEFSGFGIFDGIVTKHILMF